MSTCLLCHAAHADQPRPLLGAIRWDAWHTPWSRVQPGAGDGPVKAMVRSLGPKPYHYRLPFFGEVVSDNEVRIDGYTQEIVDREIAYAKAGGLDYWAFLLYEEGSAMSQGLSLYLSSAHKQEVGFCAIASPNTFGNAQQFPDRMQRLVKRMAEPSYQKVLGDRPLLYVFRVTDDWLRAWGGAENTRKLFDQFRAAVKAAGHGDPYLVAMNDTAAEGRRIAGVIGAESLAAYAVAGGGGKDGTAYAELAAAAQRFWEQCADTGTGVVPLAMAGWDRRPRVEHPVPWETSWQRPGVGMDRYYQEPTSQELAAHFEDAMQWAAEDKVRCPAQAVIAYAWNEHDEGGWLCPRLNPEGSANTARLDALGAMVKGFAPCPPTGPALPQEGLVLWLDANDSTPVSTKDGLVSRWSDKSAAHNNALAVDSSMRQVTCPGERKVIRFAAGSGYFRVPSLTVVQPASVFAVSRRESGQETGKYGRVLSFYDGKTSDKGNPADWVAPSWCIAVMDEAPYEAKLQTLTAPKIDGLYVGRNMARGDWYHGDLCEILVYNRVVSQPEERSLRSLLRKKWRIGLPWTEAAAPGH